MMYEIKVVRQSVLNFNSQMFFISKEKKLKFEQKNFKIDIILWCFQFLLLKIQEIMKLGVFSLQSLFKVSNLQCSC